MTEEDTEADRTRDGSFEAFYGAEYAAVVRLAFVLTGRLDVAEELAQDAFLAAHRRWATVSTYENPVAWIRRVVTNRCVSATRRRATEVRLLVRLRLDRSAGSDPDADGDHLWALVRGLSRRQAQVLALAFVEDRSVAEIARTLGMSEESVRTHLRRGRHALAAQLDTENRHG